jgi:lipid A oxidase
MKVITVSGRIIWLRGATFMRVARNLLVIILLLPNIVSAQAEVSLYGEALSAGKSQVTGHDPGGVGGFAFKTRWSGSSPVGQSNYGLRLTWWQNQTFGWGLELNHMQLSVPTNTLSSNGLNALGFSGGLNLVTINAYRRWKEPERRIAPYVGAGFGMAIPRVAFDSSAGKTSEYQVTGPAVQWVAGASYSINEHVSLFGEYKGTYSMNTADLISGGSFKTNIVTGAVNIGVSLGF